MIGLRMVRVNSFENKPNLTKELEDALNDGWSIVPGHPVPELRSGSTFSFLYLLQRENPDTKAPGAHLGAAGGE